MSTWNRLRANAETYGINEVGKRNKQRVKRAKATRTPGAVKKKYNPRRAKDKVRAIPVDQYLKEKATRVEQDTPVLINTVLNKVR